MMTLSNKFRDEYYGALVNCLSLLESGDHVNTVIAIAKYEALEKQILDSLGRERGEELILSVKSAVAIKEAERGIRFFTEQVESLTDLCRVRRLYPIPFEFTPPRDTRDLDEHIILVDSDGVALDYHLIASILYGGGHYLELVPPDEIKTRRRLFYYKIEQENGGISLNLVGDEILHDRLSEITDNLL